MANKLKNLRLNRIDLVDNGAAFDKQTGEGAHIVLFKRDAELPAASSKEITQSPTPPSSRLKTLFSSLVKKLGFSEEEAAALEKDYYAEPYVVPMPEPPAETFDQVMAANAMQELLGEFVECYWAFRDSMESIMGDPQADKVAMLAQSLEQFVMAVKTKFSAFTAGDVAKAGRKISAERLARLKQMQETLTQVIQEASQDDTMKSDKSPPVTEGDRMADKEVVKEEPVTDKTPEVTAQKGETDVQKTEPQVKEEDVLKSLPASIIEKLAKVDALEKSLQEEREVSKAARDRSEQIEFAKKHESEWSHLEGTPDVKASVLWKLSTGRDLTKDEQTAAVAMLKSANEGVKQGNLLKEIGSRGSSGVGGDAWAKIEARAKEHLAKGEVKNFEDGIAKVMDNDPQLYKAYRQEAN